MDQHFIRKLGDAFGAANVHIRTQYHVQVSSPRGFHNIWHGNEGFKLQLVGQKAWQYSKPSKIIDLIRKYQPADTDLGRMEAALSLSALIKRAIKENKVGVFVDAGWKNGMAKIAAIFVNGDRITAESFVESHPDNTSAEVAAIRFGLQHFLIKPPPIIFSDCKNAISIVGHPRVHWIQRDNNVADKIGNLRGANNA